MADDGGSVPSVGDSVLVSLCANACASPVRLYSEVAASQEVSRKKTRCDGGVAANQRFSRVMTLRMVGLAPRGPRRYAPRSELERFERQRICNRLGQAKPLPRHSWRAVRRDVLA